MHRRSWRRRVAHPEAEEARVVLGLIRVLVGTEPVPVSEPKAIVKPESSKVRVEATIKKIRG